MMKFRPGKHRRQTGRTPFPADPVDQLDRLHDLFGGGVQVVRRDDRRIGALHAQCQHVSAGAVANDASEDLFRLFRMRRDDRRVGVVQVEQVHTERGDTGEQFFDRFRVRPGCLGPVQMGMV